MIKKVIALILLLSLVFSFAACGVTQKEPEPVKPVEPDDPKEIYTTLSDYFERSDSSIEWVSVAVYAYEIEEKPKERLKYGRTENTNIENFEIRYEDFGLYLNGSKIYYKGTDLFPDYCAGNTITLGDYIYTFVEKEELKSVDGIDYVSKDTRLVKININNAEVTVYDERSYSVPASEFEHKDADMIIADMDLWVNEHVLIYGANGGVYAVLHNTLEKKLIIESDKNYDIYRRIYPISNNEFLYAKRTPEYINWYAEKIDKNVLKNGFYLYVDAESASAEGAPTYMNYFVYNAVTDKTYFLGGAASTFDKLSFVKDKNMPDMLEKYRAKRDDDLAAMGK